MRSGIIAALVIAFAYATKQPGATLTSSLLIGAGLQFMVLLLRRVVPPQSLPGVMNVFELLVDAATVLLFALGVFGGILRTSLDV